VEGRSRVERGGGKEGEGVGNLHFCSRRSSFRNLLFPIKSQDSLN
jgi:hypothetical protein